MEGPLNYCAIRIALRGWNLKLAKGALKLPKVINSGALFCCLGDLESRRAVQ